MIHPLFEEMKYFKIAALKVFGRAFLEKHPRMTPGTVA